MTRASYDVAIVGGGVIGMLVARELSDEGLTVALFERGPCGGEASWAGGGIVSPLYPWRYLDAVTALASRAQEAYPALSASLLQETGIDPELEPCGLLMLDAEDEAEAMAWARRNGRRMQSVDPLFLRERQPALSPKFHHGLWMPDVANIRNPRLVQALKVSLEQRGVSIHEYHEAGDVTRLQGAVDALWVRDSAGEEHCVVADQYVFCAGAWTGKLLRGIGQSIAVEPVRGQMLLFELPERMLSEIVLHHGRYLIPRRDHHLLVGSTLEHTGFDKQTTRDALDSLRHSAEDMLPALRDLPVKRQWAGLRPAAPGGVPFIGRLPGLGNAWVNAGQYRNGLVLAPASARLLADLMTGARPLVDPAPYTPA